MSGVDSGVVRMVAAPVDRDAGRHDHDHAVLRAAGRPRAAHRRPCRRPRQDLRIGRHRGPRPRPRQRRPGRRRVHRDHGPVRLGQVDAHALPGRPRQRRLRLGADRRRRAVRAVGQEADRAAPRPDRLRLPGLQPRPDAHRAGEHHAADRDRRPHARPAVARHRHRHARPPRPARAPAERTVRRPAAARRRRPARSPSRPQIVFGDEPTGNLDSRSSGEVLAHPAPFGRRARPDGRHRDPRPARGRATPHRVLFLADGRIVDELRDPTADARARPHEGVSSHDAAQCARSRCATSPRTRCGWR